MKLTESIPQMQKLMESCPGKTAVSGVMGFALGGAFGLFMASVCLPLRSPLPFLPLPFLPLHTTRSPPLTDAIRHPPLHQSPRRKHQVSSPTRAIKTRFQRHGRALLQFRSKFRKSRRDICGNGMLYRGFQSEERSEEWCYGGLYYRWSFGCAGGTTGCCFGMCWVCGFLTGD